MAAAVLMIGLAVAAMLISLLVWTLLSDIFRIWPTPGPGTWQSYIFWPLFRGLNVLCFIMAVLDTTGYLGLPAWLRVIAFAALVMSTGLFVYAFRVLGRDNSYGAQDGLVTRGIYRWSRNPQNAMLVVVYGCLALTTDGGGTYLLCAAMMAVYVLMVLCEEPWLEGIYGASFRRYCRRVPRFVNWGRGLILLQVAAQRCRSKQYRSKNA
jgi:protein-S-isoprenylcysteine O-methyltransferase Ste14